jgi:adenylyltransferase/sulfurtransferase
MLTGEELSRYSRQLLIPGMDEQAQEKLKDSHVLIAGVGGLGCSSSQFLVSAGVGTVTLVDHDEVSLPDLNRQVLYGEDDLGKRKVEAAAQRLGRLNSNVKIHPVFSKVEADNVERYLSGVDLVIDGMDNLSGRFVLNEACLRRGIPFIYGGIMGLRGAVSAIVPGKSPCLACIYPRQRTHEGPFPVLGAVPAIVANLQVVEAIKILSGQGASLAGRMILFDGHKMRFFHMELQRSEGCRVCGREAQ